MNCVTVNCFGKYAVGHAVLMRTWLAMYVQRYIKAPSCNSCCSGKAITVTHSERAFVALGIQHAMRMRHFISSSVDCPAVTYISILSHKLQVGRSWVQFPMMSLEFFIDITLPATLWLWGRLSLYHTWVGGLKAAGTKNWQHNHLHVPSLLKAGSLNPLERVCPGPYRDWFT